MRGLPLISTGGLASAAILAAAPVWAASDRVVIPFACEVKEDGLSVTPSAEPRSYPIFGNRRTRGYTACRDDAGEDCVSMQLHQFEMSCGGRRVSWYRVVAGMRGEKLGESALEDGRLHLVVAASVVEDAERSAPGKFKRFILPPAYAPVEQVGARLQLGGAQAAEDANRALAVEKAAAPVLVAVPVPIAKPGRSAGAGPPSRLAAGPALAARDGEADISVDGAGWASRIEDHSAATAPVSPGASDAEGPGGESVILDPSQANVWFWVAWGALTALVAGFGLTWWKRPDLIKVLAFSFVWSTATSVAWVIRKGVSLGKALLTLIGRVPAAVAQGLRRPKSEPDVGHLAKPTAAPTEADGGLKDTWSVPPSRRTKAYVARLKGALGVGGEKTTTGRPSLRERLEKVGAGFGAGGPSLGMVAPGAALGDDFAGAGIDAGTVLRADHAHKVRAEFASGASSSPVVLNVAALDARPVDDGLPVEPNEPRAIPEQELQAPVDIATPADPASADSASGSRKAATAGPGFMQRAVSAVSGASLGGLRGLMRGRRVAKPVSRSNAAEDAVQRAQPAAGRVHQPAPEDQTPSQPAQRIDAQNLQNGLKSVEALFAQVADAVGAVKRESPLRETLEFELRNIAHRISVFVGSGDKTPTGPRAAATLRGAVRDLERVRRIAESAIVSLPEGRANAARALDLPQTKIEAYEILGVNADVSEATLKKVVDGLRMSWHPDHAKNDADRVEREARIKQINVAVALINNNCAA